jgi:hypothetical protein
MARPPVAWRDRIFICSFRISIISAFDSYVDMNQCRRAAMRRCCVPVTRSRAQQDCIDDTARNARHPDTPAEVRQPFRSA